MPIAKVSQRSTEGLPETLRTAQAAIHLPEVQEMLRRLSDYNLGIFMPHMHDEGSGDFQALTSDVIQVESGLEVSFKSREEVAHQGDLLLPVGWRWSAGAPTTSAACVMVHEEGRGETDRKIKHKMPKGN